MLRPLLRAAFLILTFGALPAAAAEEAVQLSGGYGLLNAPARPSAAVVLIPGGNGYLGIRPDGSFSGLRGNQLVRTRQAYASAGVASLVIDAGVSASSAITYLRTRFNRPVTVVATSRGTLQLAGALSARPNGMAITAGFLNEVRGQIGSAASLPPTLVVHHRQDGCRVTPPSAVEPFKDWGGARVRVVWMEGGQDRGDPCQAAGHHGFAGLDGRVVGTVAAFAKGVR